MAKPSVIFFSVISMILTVLGAVDISAATNRPAPTTEPAAPPPDPYTPGLGDFMTAYVQPHHIKLWLAANAGNWQLAAYEASELRETFEDISTYQATWKNAPVAKLVETIIAPTLKDVDAAIARKDLTAFQTDFTALTAGCNSCHSKVHHGFLIIQVPRANPFSDQEFTPR